MFRTLFSLSLPVALEGIAGHADAIIALLRNGRLPIARESHSEDILKTDFEAARREIIRAHIFAICERNEPILSELEERWNWLNRAFATDRGLHRYAKQFADHYDPLTKLSGEQCALASSVETFADVLPCLDALSDLTQKVDHHIAKLFELLSEIEVECFRRLAEKAQEVSL